MPSQMPSIVRRVRNVRPIRLPSIAREATGLPRRAVRWGMRTGIVEGVLNQVHVSPA